MSVSSIPRLLDASFMMTSFMDSQDGVFSLVSAQVNPRLCRQLENFEDVLAEVEQKTGLEIRFSRKRYCFVGSWNQIIRAKEMLEQYTAEDKPYTINSSETDQELQSFEVINGNISRVQQWRNGQGKQSSPEGRQLAEKEPRSRHSSNVDYKQDEIASKDKKVQSAGAEIPKTRTGAPDFVETEHSGRSQVSADSEQKKSSDFEERLTDARDQVPADSQKGAPQGKVEGEQGSERSTVIILDKERPGSQMEPAVTSSDVLLINAEVLDYMDTAGVLSELRKQYSIDFIVNKENGENKESEDVFVTIIAAKEKPINATDILLAQEAFIIEYQRLLQGCAREICEAPPMTPDECLAEAHADCLMRFPDILMKTSPTKRNLFIFIGPAAKVKICSHYFMTQVSQHRNRVGYPYQRSRVAANINQDVHLQGNHHLQCEEARTILAERLAGQQASSGSEVVVMQEAEPTMPDLEDSDDLLANEQNKTDEQQRLRMADAPTRNQQNKDDLAQKSKQIKKPVIEVFESSDDDDDDDGRVDTTSREPDSGSHQQMKQQKLSAVVKDEDGDAELQTKEYLGFPKQWLISVSEGTICPQCADNTTQLVHLGCGHKFCLTCVKNKSRMDDACPECGKRFSRDQFNQLVAEMVDRPQKWQHPVDIPDAKMAKVSLNGKIEFKPVMQEDGTFINSSDGKICEQCSEAFHYLIQFKCGHELCLPCYRSLPPNPTCPSCGTIVKIVKLSPRNCEISYVMDKKTPLPNFPKLGTILVQFVVEGGTDKNIQYSDARFEIYLPNNAAGRTLYKLFLDIKKQKKLFEVLPIAKGKGIVCPVGGLDLKCDQAAVDKDYLSALEKTLQKILKEE